MNKHAKMLAAAALVLCLSTTAFAQVTPAPRPAPSVAQMTEPGTLPVVIVTPLTVAVYGSPRNDPTVIAALAALNTGLSRYDMLVKGILNHTQEIDFAAALKHGDWFSMYPLNDMNVNGYIAYLSQRLHLDPDQEREVSRIEGHFLADIVPLYTAYQDAFNRVVAERRAQLSRALEMQTQPTVATPPVEEPAVRRVEVKGTKPPAPKQFIRNRDRK